MALNVLTLYTHVPQPGGPIPIKVAPFPVDDTIPGEKKIAELLTRLRMHRARGTSVIKAKHLSMWHRAAKQEENPNPGNWEKVVAIIKEAFRVG